MDKDITVALRRINITSFYMTKKKSRFVGSVATLVLMFPLVAGAQDLNGLVDIASAVSEIVGILIPIAFALILLFFFWGLAKYMFGDAEDKEKGKNLMIWGVIALFVAASIWGLVAFLGEVFGVDPETDENSPTVTPEVLSL